MNYVRKPYFGKGNEPPAELLLSSLENPALFRTAYSIFSKCQDGNEYFSVYSQPILVEASEGKYISANWI